MKNFSFNRFTAYCAAEIAVQGRQLLLTTIGGLGVAILIYLLCGISHFEALFSGESIVDTNFGFRYVMTARSILLVFYCIYVAFIISNGFSNYHKTLKASWAMLLPVSKAEKFLYTVLTYSVAVPLLTGAALFAVDALFCYIYGVQVDPMLENPFSSWQSIIQSLLGGGAAVSAFLLGSVLFRRRQLLYTVLSVLGVSLIWSSLVACFVMFVVKDSTVAVIFPAWLSDMVNYGVQPLMVIALVWLAWYKFRKLEIR